MKTTIKYLAPWMAATAPPIASAATPQASTAPASVGSAGTDPLVPFGTDPHSPYVFGYHTSDHDESNTTNGQLDTAF